ncbi:hypothetical protein [Massilia putida]|uniref:hypothetical protein n=1 Tax=Massilia putida TaxID=1141883 RepID=UPI000952388F|nr:hypothetical protein [Massilia putida]
MTAMTSITRLFCIGSLLAAFSHNALAQDKQFGASIPKETQTVALSEVVKHPDLYKGKTLAVTGTLGDMCSDGDDFFFKDKFDLIEVVPPRGVTLPYKDMKGAKTRVYGKVMVRRGEVHIDAQGVAFE